MTSEVEAEAVRSAREARLPAIRLGSPPGWDAYKVKPYYEKCGIVIYHGDCREVLPTLQNVDAWFADPPYGVELDVRYTKDSERVSVYSQFDDTHANVVATCVPVIRSLVESGVRGALTPGSECAFDYPRPDVMGCLFFPSGAGMCAWGFQCHQPLFFYGKCPYLGSGQGGRPTGVMWHTRSEEFDHPCPKPIGLMKWVVNRVSIAGETIIDPFMGSGTTLVAAKQLDRKAIGIEIEERYCEIAARRLEDTTPSLFAQTAGRMP